ncbi:hypothetical protein K470DRAFT_206949, partial [Piedraia hortae CBS 480.64]
HPALSSLPKVIEGGQAAEPLYNTSKMRRLQDEAEKLQKEIGEKEGRKRKGLLEWEKLARDVDVAALKSQLAEKMCREFSGESEAARAF